MNVFIRAMHMVKIFSFGERWNVPFHSAVASWNGKFHLSPHENIFTIALINIHYLYNIRKEKWNLFVLYIKSALNCSEKLCFVVAHTHKNKWNFFIYMNCCIKIAIFMCVQFKNQHQGTSHRANLLQPNCALHCAARNNCPLCYIMFETYVAAKLRV